MNKKDFIETLELQLIRLPKADRDDILSDYENHFDEGLERGLSEEEVSASLGDPNELAATYLENLPAGAKGAPYVPQMPQTPPQPNPQPAWTPTRNMPVPPPPQPGPQTQSAAADNTGGIIAVVILSMIMLTCVLPAAIGLICGAFGGGVGIGAASVAVFVGAIAVMPGGVLFGLGLIFIAVALAALCVLFFIGGIALCKLCVIVGKSFINWCNKTVGGSK